MLKGKRAVVTGGGRDFGQAVAVWLAREGVDVCLSARRLADAEQTCELIRAEGGSARAYACDMADAASVGHFASALLAATAHVDILILSAAQWLEGQLDDAGPAEIVSTLNAGVTGSVLLTQALLPGLRRSTGSDIIALVSSCGVPGFTDSVAHPAFFAAKHALSGFSQNLAHRLADDNIRVTALYPPDFEVTGLDVEADGEEKMGERLLSARSVWETIRFVLTQPRSCHIGTICFHGPTRASLAEKSAT